LKSTIKDVASAAGVSVGTASRVVNGIATVNSDLRARVLKAVADLGYKPNAIAQSMRLKTTQTVAIVIRDISVPGLSALVKSAQAVLGEAGYTVVLAVTGDQPAREIAVLNALAGRQVDGLILTTASDSDPALLTAREGLGVPVVLLDRAQSGNADTVEINYRDGTRQAVEYLIRLGHRRIALITGSSETRPGRERSLGYQDAFAAAGLQHDPGLIRCRSFGSEYAFSEATALLNQHERPTAIIAGAVGTLPSVLRAAATCNVSVPEELSVIGCINTELSELLTPPVTVVDVDYAALGKAAAGLLLDRIDQALPDPTPRKLSFGTTLIIRGSCLAPAVK